MLVNSGRQQTAASVDDRQFADDTARLLARAGLPRADDRTSCHAAVAGRYNMDAAGGLTGTGHRPVLVREDGLPDVRAQFPNQRHDGHARMTEIRSLPGCPERGARTFICNYHSVKKCSLFIFIYLRVDATKITNCAKLRK